VCQSLAQLVVLSYVFVHQDTKFNNVLLDENDEVLCVIDLDTVMPGYVCYDIGDAIRNGANTGKEDDPNLDNVSINMDLYEGFIKGFLQETKEILTPVEKDTLAFGAKLLTYEQAVRFLDDYIDGDKYYKTESPDHNLIRARAQIKLLKSMDEKISEIFDLRPGKIIKRLGLKNPIFTPTAAYGHMGRDPYTAKVKFLEDGKEVERDVEFFTWEKLDYVDQIKNAFGL